MRECEIERPRKTTTALMGKLGPCPSAQITASLPPIRQPAVTGRAHPSLYPTHGTCFVLPSPLPAFSFLPPPRAPGASSSLSCLSSVYLWAPSIRLGGCEAHALGAPAALAELWRLVRMAGQKVRCRLSRSFTCSFTTCSPCLASLEIWLVFAVGSFLFLSFLLDAPIVSTSHCTFPPLSWRTGSV